jgi:CheY-like chemotaxis protein
VRILLADDSVTAQNMGKKILTEAGHEVLCVSNGAAALKKVSEQEPELVILDIYMPGYGGLEVCQRLKENPGTAGLPVVLTVGKLEPFRKEDAQRVRAEALIVKPFEASELQAAVARFAEIAASAPARPKKSKAAPPSKAEPQPFSDDDYVTTSQREGQKEGESASAVAGGADEFTVTPASEPAVAETQWGSVAPAEFSVHEPETNASAVEAKAAAAAAGADFGSAGEVAPVGSVEPAANFAVAAPAEPAIPQSSASSAQTAEEAPAGAPAGFGIEAPAVDPAFDPDRTQWVTQFATRFGVEEEPVPETTEEVQPEAGEGAQPELNEEAQAEAGEEAPPQASGEAQAQTGPTPNEEIAAILSTLPGGMSGSAEPQPAAAGEQFRPWPLDASTPAEEQWKAEEVPVEDRDSSVSLADEMEKAFGTMPAAPSSFATAEEPAPEPQAAPFQPPPAMPVQVSETVPTTAEALPPEAAAQEAPAAPFEAPLPSNEAISIAAEESSPAPTELAEPAPASPAAEIKPGPDRVAGVMQSAAMAIATRATVSAVASQLHAEPAAEVGSAGPSAIEELVGQVLDRLRPKLIAEIKRELKTPEEK